MIVLAVYALISGYASFKFGGSDELFLVNPPVEFMNVFKEIHQVVYDLVMIILAAILMHLMYLPIYISERQKLKFQDDL